MVKKKRHIWFFICGIGTANLIMGLAIYYGIATWVSKFLTKIVNAYPLYVYGAAAIGGIVLLGAGIRLIIKTRQSNAEKNNNGCEETENVKAPAQLSPVSLFIMGAAFCMVELTSAFPYFGFLALLTSYHLIFPLALLFMLIYNFMYMLPLILLYFGYNKLQGTTTIKKLESVLDKVSSYIVPVVVSLVGILLVYYGVTSLIPANKKRCRCRNTHSHNGCFYFFLRRKLKGLFLMFGDFDSIFFNIFCSSGGSL